MPAALTLYLVRHGVADDATGRCVGHHDLALSPAGADGLARLGQRWPLPRPTRVVASDLARARDSAAVLAGGWSPSPPVATDARLREMHFGAWDGRRWADVERDDAQRMLDWMARWHEARVPEGEGFGDVIARAAAWLADAVQAARVDGRDALAVVAHAGSIRALLVHALGLPPALAFRLRVDHARVSALRVPIPDGDATAAGCAGAGELLSLNCDRIPGEDR